MDHLLDAIDRLRDTGVERNGYLANHGPMGAEALVSLGYGAQAPGWAQHYRERRELEAAAPPGRVLGTDWRYATGNPRRLPDWITTFETELAEHPWREVLAAWWPRLLPGWAASATHGVIRTAHAVRALGRYPGSPTGTATPPPLLLGELAQGLGLWAARYQLLPGDPDLAGRHSAREALRALPRVRAGEPVSGGAIGGELARLVRVRGFDRALDAYGAPADPQLALDELIRLAATVLATHEDEAINFCHAVTGPAALRLVLPHLPLPLHRPTVAAAWHTIGAIVAATSTDASLDGLDQTFDEPDRSGRPEPFDRGRLAERAVEHGDEHVIKLVEAALREHARSGEPVLLHAADRHLGRVTPAPTPGG